MSVPLRSISDQEILFRIQELVARERKLTLSVLLHLNEIERRQLYLKLGHSSLFDYCTTHLRFSESAAMRRIKTARCIARFPELCELLESGEVNLSTVSLVSRTLTEDNRAEVVARIKGKSQREVEAVVVEYEPRAAVPPDRVRTIVVPAGAVGIRTPREADAQCTESYRRSGGKISTSNEARPVGAGDGNVSSPSIPRTEKLAVIQFSAREPFMNKMGIVRSLAAHRLQGAVAFEHVFELLMDYFIAREDPARRQERRESRNQIRPNTNQPRSGSRSIPARVRDQVMVRDRQQCTYVGPNGKRCASTHALQVDHITPVARGGSASIENLRLLCAKHNRLEAERLMGFRRTRDQVARPATPVPASH